jgi:DnaJ-class molecular chaperone
MRNFYSVLRVVPKASEAEIKTAYRVLAKTCHPDLKPGDRQAEQTFHEATRAYTVLSNPETRKMYDALLAERSAAERQRRRRSVATMSATFVLTAAAVIGTFLWLNVGNFSLAGGRASAGSAERGPMEMAGASDTASAGPIQSEPTPADRAGRR